MTDLAAAKLDDGGWRRLAWELPAALVVAALALGAFMHLLTLAPDRPPPAPRELQAEVVELAPSPPAPVAPAPPPEPAPPPPPKAEAPPEPPPPPKLAPRPEPPPPPRIVKPRPPPPAPPPPARTAPPPPVAPPPAAATPSPPAAPPSGGRMSARAIYQPLPQIPETLRRRDVDVVAIALFHVAADGSATVELVQATFEPSLNRALLDTLKTWRFFPALDQGRPVASTIEIRIPVSVH